MTTSRSFCLWRWKVSSETLWLTVLAVNIMATKLLTVRTNKNIRVDLNRVLPPNGLIRLVVPRTLHRLPTGESSRLMMCLLKLRGEGIRVHELGTGVLFVLNRHPLDGTKNVVT